MSALTQVTAITMCDGAGILSNNIPNLSVPSSGSINSQKYSDRSHDLFCQGFGQQCHSVVSGGVTLVAFFLKVFPYSCLCQIYKHFYFMPVLDIQTFLFHAYDCVRYTSIFIFMCLWTAVAICTWRWQDKTVVRSPPIPPSIPPVEAAGQCVIAICSWSSLFLPPPPPPLLEPFELLHSPKLLDICLMLCFYSTALSTHSS